LFAVQLPVKDHPNVQSALREYVADADLSGDNQYQMPDSKETVDAVKRTRFSSLPPVLHLHLLRFTYSSVTGAKEKINSVRTCISSCKSSRATDHVSVAGRPAAIRIS
jgi:ubiquitin carboxyl-terminal hydrolase 7